MRQSLGGSAFPGGSLGTSWRGGNNPNLFRCNCATVSDNFDRGKKLKHRGTEKTEDRKNGRYFFPVLCSLCASVFISGVYSSEPALSRAYFSREQLPTYFARRRMILLTQKKRQTLEYPRRNEDFCSTKHVSVQPCKSAEINVHKNEANRATRYRQLTCSWFSTDSTPSTRRTISWAICF